MFSIRAFEIKFQQIEGESETDPLAIDGAQPGEHDKQIPVPQSILELDDEIAKIRRNLITHDANLQKLKVIYFSFILLSLIQDNCALF